MSIRPAIVLDANQLGNTPVEQNLQFKVFQEVANRLGSDLIIPRIVWLEHLHRMSDNLMDRYAKDWVTAKEDGEALPSWAETQLGWKTQAQNWSKTYDATRGSELLITDDYVLSDYQTAFNREIWRLAPASGGRGARDTLIWLDVLRLLDAGSSVTLVSNDHPAFGNGQMRQDLLWELPDEHRNNIHLVNDLRRLLEMHSLLSVAPSDLGGFDEMIRATVNERLGSRYILGELVTKYVPGSGELGFSFSTEGVELLSHQLLKTETPFEFGESLYVGAKADYAGLMRVVRKNMESNVFDEWKFDMKGVITFFAEVTNGEVSQSEVLDFKFDRRNSQVTPPGGHGFTFRDARRLINEARSLDEFVYPKSN